VGRATTSIALEAAGVLLVLVCSACTSASSGPTTTVITVPEGLPGNDTVVYPPDSAGPCTKSADCMTDQVCCVTDFATTKTDCRHGPCPYLPAGSGWGGGPIQACRTAAECLIAGDVCPELPNPGNLVLFCQAPLDAGSASEPDAALAADTDVDAATDAAADASASDAADAAGE
jgi:hypothetical protein